MPPLTSTKVGISFDAQNTLIEIVGGIGLQYFNHFKTFLHTKGFSIEEVMPSCTATSLHTTCYTVMRYLVSQDREAWAAEHPHSDNAKEMPIGGRTEASINKFWCRTMQDVFRSPTLFLSTPPRLKQPLLDVMEGKEWDEFLNSVLFHFSTTDCYSWMPGSLRCLEELRRWNLEQEELVYKSGLTDRRKQRPVIVLAAPPFVVTNSDHRIRQVLNNLGALSSTSSLPNGKRRPPLLGKVVTAGEVGFAKPSPRGIQQCIRECGLERNPERFVHVGDAEDDELACKAAGCCFMPCNASTGIQWDKLKSMLLDLQKGTLKSA